MIDIHSHILPFLDDGPESLDESIAMAEEAARDGIRTIVATPHSFNGTYENSHEDISTGVAAFIEALKEREVTLAVSPGAEVHFCAGMAQKALDDEFVTINNHGRHILVEFPFHSVPKGYKEELFQLKLNGITPIVAHPERCPMFQDRPGRLFDLVEMGCLAQVTAMSITGDFGGETMAFSHELLEKRLVHVIASDSHSAGYRTPKLSQAVEVAGDVLGSREEAEKMVRDTPEAILEGKPVSPYKPERKNKRRKWFFGFL